MITLLKKELNSFFSSLIGYLSIIVFLLVMGLFVWFIPETSVLEFGYATLEPYFYIAPMVLMFLIPAITMRMFSEEFSSGTMELLITRPIKDGQIILAKFLAAFILVVFSLLPTLVYYYSVYQLGSPIGNIDSGAFFGSFLGLLGLGACFTSIGLFCSSVSRNQIVSFLFGLFLCFFLYMGLDFLSRMPGFIGKYDYIIEQVGLMAHFESISRGVVDTRDVLYFVSVILFFNLLTKTALSSRKW